MSKGSAKRQVMVRDWILVSVRFVAIVEVVDETESLVT